MAKNAKVVKTLEEFLKPRKVTYPGTDISFKIRPKVVEDTHRIRADIKEIEKKYGKEPWWDEEEARGLLLYTYLIVEPRVTFEDIKKYPDEIILWLRRELFLTQSFRGGAGTKVSKDTNR
jgi:hypothetical protein